MIYDILRVLFWAKIILFAISVENHSLEPVTVSLFCLKNDIAND